MDSIFRAMFIYFFLMFLLRIVGKRTLNEMTTFDFVLILILGDSSQQAIASNDYSIINAVVIISTLMMLDALLSYLKFKFNIVEKIIDGSPMLLIDNFKLNKNIMTKEKINEADILESARMFHGLESLDKIKYAILEKDGEISIIPAR